MPTVLTGGLLLIRLTREFAGPGWHADINDSMSRYYFNVRRGEAIFEDHVGVVLPDLSAAWSWAVSDALALIQDGYVDPTSDRCWMEVCDAEHRAVLSFPIGRATLH
jgi:hypothetical protein